MTNEDIIRMAQKAGLAVSAVAPEIGVIWCSEEYPIDEEIYRFAELVAAAEREACAQVCVEQAKIVSNQSNGKTVALHCAHYVRARGQS